MAILCKIAHRVGLKKRRKPASKACRTPKEASEARLCGAMALAVLYFSPCMVHTQARSTGSKAGEASTVIAENPKPFSLPLEYHKANLRNFPITLNIAPLCVSH